MQLDITNRLAKQRSLVRAPQLQIAHLALIDSLSESDSESNPTLVLRVLKLEHKVQALHRRLQDIENPPID